MNLRDTIKLIVLFAVSYILLYFLPAITKALSPEMALHEWGFTLNPSMLDYTFFLMPFVGFFFIYFLIDWINDYFKSDFGYSVFFPLLFVVLSFMAFYVQLYWYFSNLASLAASQGRIINPGDLFDFWSVLRNDAFLVFIFSGLTGWISYKVMQRVSESALEENRKQAIAVKSKKEVKEETKEKPTEEKSE